MLPILDFDTTTIETAIQAAELRTSGEIRVCVERRHCSDIIVRAKSIFEKLGMAQTAEKNGILLYVHLRLHRVVVLGDTGIDQKVAPGFWQDVCDAVTGCFARKDMTVGIVLGVMMIGESLARYYPLEKNTVKENQLPDAIIIGDKI